MYRATMMEMQQSQDLRRDLGMRVAGTPVRFGLQAPEISPQVKNVMNTTQMGEMSKLIRKAVVKYMVRDVVALRRQAEGSRSLIVEEEQVQLMAVLKSTNASSSVFVDSVVSTCVPSKEFKEVSIAV
jgi:hypothetical protein